MFKKALFLLPLLCSAAALYAQEAEPTDAEVSQYFDTLGKEMTEAFPKPAAAMQKSFVSMVEAVAPALISIAENKALPAATREMGQQVLAVLPQEYARDAKITADDELNELKISGSYDGNDGDDELRYEITRNLAATVMAQNLMDNKTFFTMENAGENVASSILNLDNESLDAKKFAVRKIDGKPFYTYDDKEKQELFLIGNIGSYLNIRIQAEGPGSRKMTRGFVESLDYEALRKAVRDDNRPLEEIINGIRKQVNDPAVLEKLSEQQQPN